MHHIWANELSSVKVKVKVRVRVKVRGRSRVRVRVMDHMWADKPSSRLANSSSTFALSYAA